MKLKVFAITGLVFLILNQVMLLGGNEFIQNQQPIDYAHWLLFIGVLFCLSLNYIFSDSLFSNTATVLTSLGVVALIGQATIDFLWWSYGTDYGGMDQLINQVMERPSIRIPFITIGPALFYLGLATHAGKLIRRAAIWALLAIAGVIIIGTGSFIYNSRLTIIIGHIILSWGILMLAFKKDIAIQNPNN
ncbi:hypothetical protein [Robiginitalea sp. IMCC43444]|uniref:hypothetical protein n=1 Tax=Robiginitalea sp. IMCC43444 TaxID=3459121 RepID=UPI004041D6DD